jgi:hypothetical protein
VLGPEEQAERLREADGRGFEVHLTSARTGAGLPETAASLGG